MKRLLMLAFTVIIVTGLAYSQPVHDGSIDIFSDLGQTSCDIVDQMGQIDMYIFHTHTNTGAMASQWRLETPSGWAPIRLSVTPQVPFLSLGDIDTDYSVAYINCQTGSFPIATVSYFGSGNSTGCEYFSILPAADSLAVGIIECVDETFEYIPRGGQARTHNLAIDPGCACTVPIEETTWGRIKSLYE